MDAGTALTVAAAGFGVGLAIGTTAIGGVLLAPILVFALGMEVQSAIALALWSFLWSGLIAVTLYARRGSIEWRLATWLCLAAAPAAWAGAAAAGHLSPPLLQGLIGTLVTATGANVLLPSPVDGLPRSLPPGTLLVLGGLTGFGSAMLGAGGAVILTPLLIALKFPLLPAIGMGQIIQVPISLAASVRYLAAGDLDLTLGLWLPVALALGIACGTPLAHALPQHTLRNLLGITMIIAGAAMLARVAHGV